MGDESNQTVGDESNSVVGGSSFRVVDNGSARQIVGLGGVGWGFTPMSIMAIIMLPPLWCSILWCFYH